MIGLAGAIGIGLVGAAPAALPVIGGYDFTGATLNGATLTRASTGRYLSDADVLTSAAIDAARFDYVAGGGLAGLLIEPARTNVLLRSEEFDNASWTKTNVTITANAAVAPDGATTMDRMVETTANAAHMVVQTFSATSGQAYTLTVYAKAAERSILGLAMNQIASQAPSYFNLADGTIGTTQAGQNVSIEHIGGGIYRCRLTVTATSTATASWRIHVCAADNNFSYTGNASNGLLIWGAQVENAATPSSYIPTTTVAVARSADVLALLAPAGTATARYTFDDLTTQDVATSAGAYNAPTNLNRSRLRSVAYL